MSDHSIVLASASPRRVELLRCFDLPFQVCPSEVEELHDETIDVKEICSTNAHRKAAEITAQFPDYLTIGADTLVALDGALFGKPKDLGEAFVMLRRLSGRVHQVITAVALLQPKLQRAEVFTDVTHVHFKPLHDHDIEAYLKVVPVLDKAGAYGIQEQGHLLVERFEGSFSNVMGLPIEKLADYFCRWNLITPLARDKIVASRKFERP